MKTFSFIEIRVEQFVCFELAKLDKEKRGTMRASLISILEPLKPCS